MYLYRVISIVYNIFATMAEDWNECASAYSKTKAMMNKAILSHRFSKYTIGMYTLCLVLLGASNMLAQKSAGSEQPVEERQLIIKMNLPFDYTASPVYEVVMIIQFLLQYVSAILAGMLNAFTVTLVS